MKWFTFLQNVWVFKRKKFFFAKRTCMCVCFKRVYTKGYTWMGIDEYWISLHKNDRIDVEKQAHYNDIEYMT